MNFDEILDEMPDDIRELNWEVEGLVGQFKLGLKKVGVEITETEGNRNSCVLKKGGMSTGVLIYPYTPRHLHTEHKGIWGVRQEMVERMQKEKEEIGRDWGVVFLLGTFNETTLNVGFWVTSENFERDRTQLSLGSNGTEYKVTLQRLRDDRLLNKKFSTVEDFLRLSGLNPTGSKGEG